MSRDANHRPPTVWGHPCLRTIQTTDSVSIIITTLLCQMLSCSSTIFQLSARQKHDHRQTFIRRACPLWMGLRSWNAKTASAPRFLNSVLSSFGVSRYSSSPSPHVILWRTSMAPPTSQSPDSRIILQWDSTKHYHERNRGETWDTTVHLIKLHHFLVGRAYSWAN